MVLVIVHPIPVFSGIHDRMMMMGEWVVQPGGLIQYTIMMTTGRNILKNVHVHFGLLHWNHASFVVVVVVVSGSGDTTTTTTSSACAECRNHSRRVNG
jgi:hypothetical protein